MATQKAKNCKSNNNNNNNSSMKENKTPQNEMASLLFSSSSMVNFPITPDDFCVTLRFSLNIDHPYMNIIQGALPFQIPSCQQTRIINERLLVITIQYVGVYLVGTVLVFFKHRAWLLPDGSELFVMMLPTGRCFTTQQNDGLHHCKMTRPRVGRIFSLEIIPSVLLCSMNFQTIWCVLTKYLMSI